LAPGVGIWIGKYPPLVFFGALDCGEREVGKDQRGCDFSTKVGHDAQEHAIFIPDFYENDVANMIT
jgi:hypothetical protein